MEVDSNWGALQLGLRHICVFESDRSLVMNSAGKTPSSAPALVDIKVIVL